MIGRGETGRHAFAGQDPFDRRFFVFRRHAVGEFADGRCRDTALLEFLLQPAAAAAFDRDAGSDVRSRGAPIVQKSVSRELPQRGVDGLSLAATFDQFAPQFDGRVVAAAEQPQRREARIGW